MRPVALDAKTTRSQTQLAVGFELHLGVPLPFFPSKDWLITVRCVAILINGLRRSFRLGSGTWNAAMMVEIAIASLMILTLANLLVISTMRIETKSIVWPGRERALRSRLETARGAPDFLGSGKSAPRFPIAFPSRLANYLNCEESHLFGAWLPSSMTFWAIGDWFDGKPARSRAYIRGLLKRIQRTIRDD